MEGEKIGMVGVYEEAFSTKLEYKDVLWSFQPEPRFPTLSITGKECALNCDFCQGKYIRSMPQIKNPEDLYDVCLELESGGAKGVLLSGGYNKRGYVPFERYADVISQIKKDSSLFLSFHSGLMPSDLIQKLADAGVDMVDFNMVAKKTVITSKLEEEKSGEYREVLNLFDEKIPHMSPHILLGLGDKELETERKTLELLEDIDLTAIVFLVLIPPKNSEKYEIPEPERIGEIISNARQKFRDVPLALGCMRPRKEKKTVTEIQALKAGIDRIVLPSEKTKKIARKLNLEVRDIGSCCAVPEKTLERWYDGQSS